MGRSPWIKPVPLEDLHVRLEPLRLAHVSGLQAAVRDGELWRLWSTQIPAPETMGAYVRQARGSPRDPDALAFAVRTRPGGQVVGCTRYLNVDAANRRLEIGGTWYARSVQRTPLNTACKLLLLTHAFEALDAIAVEFRTHWMNHASRTAIARLGAKQDGVLRNHRILPDGTYRDTVVFSILEHEWPMVKRHLQALLGPRSGTKPIHPLP